jgi:hypothetical protein
MWQGCVYVVLVLFRYFCSLSRLCFSRAMACCWSFALALLLALLLPVDSSFLPYRDSIVGRDRFVTPVSKKSPCQDSPGQMAREVKLHLPQHVVTRVQSPLLQAFLSAIGTSKAELDYLMLLQSSVVLNEASLGLCSNHRPWFPTMYACPSLGNASLGNVRAQTDRNRISGER